MMQPEDIRLIHVVADYGEKDPAFSEVFHRLKRQFPNADIQNTPVPRFSTVATGFWIAQLGLHSPRIENSFIYSNTAPRRVDDTEGNNGRGFVMARLENGTRVFTVNSGHCLSFVRDSIEELREVEVRKRGSQFRSRDFFPGATSEAIETGGENLGARLEPSGVPEPPEASVGFVDGYGNIKTTIRKSELELEGGQKVRISIAGASNAAYHKRNTFEVPKGELSLAPGSSGGEDPFLEIMLRGGSAAQKFGGVQPGESVGIGTKDV
jgi:S-adenosylmethionine hydrolase